MADRINPRFERLLAEMRLHVGALADQVGEAGRKADLLGKLFVQVERLHQKLDFNDVLEAVHETLVNLIGSEDFAVMVRDETTNTYRVLSSMGMASTQLGEFRLGQGPLGAAAASGQIKYGDPVAVVPLASGFDGSSMGVVVVMALLAHKPELTSDDRLQLELLSHHAGVALEAALCAADARQSVKLSRMQELLASAPAGLVSTKGML